MPVNGEGACGRGGRFDVSSFTTGPEDWVFDQPASEAEAGLGAVDPAGALPAADGVIGAVGTIGAGEGTCARPGTEMDGALDEVNDVDGIGVAPVAGAGLPDGFGAIACGAGVSGTCGRMPGGGGVAVEGEPMSWRILGPAGMVAEAADCVSILLSGA